jgi:hypothetical protein
VRLTNSGRRARSAKPPTVPPELIAALRVKIDDLRPWEYGNMESDEYLRIMDVQNVYRRALQMYPSQWDVMKHDE